MQLKMLSGYPDNVGRRHLWCGYGPGPTAYAPVSPTAGDVLQPPRFQFYFDSVIPGTSFNPTTNVAGTYLVYGVAFGVGARLVWKLKWVTASSGAEVAAGTDLSAFQVQLSGFGGQF